MPVMRGMAYPTSATRAYLWTMGYVPRLDTYPGWEVPNPLAIDVLRGVAPLEVVLADVMALTKLNYNSADYSATLPVTLGFAEAVGSSWRRRTMVGQFLRCRSAITSRDA